jgi:hypothetical protein
MIQTFPLATDQSWRPIWGILIILPVGVILSYLLLAPRLLRFEVSPEHLHIKGDLFYGRQVPLRDLQLEQARAIDLTESPDYRLTLRTNGTGLPHYKSGWFRLGNGGEALVFLGDSRRAVVVPHREGHVLILSPSEPASFIEALKTASAQ